MSEIAPSIEAAVETFLAERRSGSTIDARVFAERHPTLMPGLLDALLSAEFLEGARGAIDVELAPSVPERIGSYRVERAIGRGGMGVVLEAIEEPLGRRVALKLLPPELLASPAARTRFRREAVLASRLEHSGICTVFGAGVTDGQPWIAMRYVDGTTLAKRIASAKERGLACVELANSAGPRTIAMCIARVARALAYAHAQGVLHRDVKPSNVAVDDAGEPVLLDFGLAIEPESDASVVTRTGETAGTPGYLAPELFSGERARPDGRCDVYALGVTLYECLALAPPFNAPTREALYRAVVSGAPDVRRANRGVPRDLAVIVATALERDPAKRYASAELFANDLEAFVSGRPIAARPVGAWGRVARWAKREPKQAVLASTLSVAALALTLVAGILLASQGEVRAGRAAHRTSSIEAELLEAFGDLVDKRTEQADVRFRRVLEIDPQNADAKLGRVLALLYANRDDDARQLLADAPHTPDYERLRAIAERKPPLAEDAAWLARASASELFVDGEALRVHARRGPPSERAEWMRRALARYDEAVVRAPQARVIYHQMRSIAASESDDEPATRSACAALLALWPDSPRATYHAGASLTKLDPRAALPLLERAAELDPQHAATYQGIGIAYLTLREPDAALAPFRRAIELDPHNHDGYNNLGCALMNMGCRTEARAAFETAVALEPRAIRAWGNLCVLATDNEGSARAAQHVLELDPDQPSYRAVYGAALELMGDMDGALAQLGIVVASVPDQPVYWLGYTRMLANAGELETARDAARITRELKPDIEGLEEIEAYLESELGAEDRAAAARSD